MKLIKRLFIAGFLLIALVVGIGLYSIDKLARVGIEKGATFALGVPTTLADFKLGIFAGTVGLHELDIANPEGFTDRNFMQLADARLAVSLATLSSDRIVVPEFKLTGINLNLERRMTGSNYTQIIENLDRLSSPAADDDKKPDEQSGGKHFVISNVVIEDINVKVNMIPLGGKITSVPVAIPRIELHDLGTDSDNGLAMAELSGIIMKALLESVVVHAGGLLPPEIAGELKNGLESLAALGEVPIKLVGDVTTLVGGEVVKVAEVGADVIKTLHTGTVKATEDIGKGVKKVGDDIGEGFQKTGEELGKGLQGTTEGLKKGVDDLGKGMGDLFKPKDKTSDDGGDDSKNGLGGIGDLFKPKEKKPDDAPK